MSWKGSLGRRKFYSILLASSIEMIVGILMSLIDTGVTGHILGETGLSVMNLLCILVLAIPFGMLFGTQGMMLGYALAPYLTIAILFAYIVLRYGRDRFPDLLEPADNILLNRTITLGEEEIMQLVYDAHVILENNHTDKKTEHSLELVLEEILLLILEKNRGEEPRKKQKKIYAEVCIRTGQKGTDLSVWDSGEIFDATDVDNEVVSFLDYITARILSLQHERKHMVATSFNKNFFHFD